MVQPLNPYWVGGPVPSEKFIGRKTIVRSLCERILTKQHTALYGESGTSSLLNYVNSPRPWQEWGWSQLRNSTVIILINCDALRPTTSSRFWRELTTRLQNQPDLQGDRPLQTVISLALGKADVSLADFYGILREFKGRNQWLTLLLDDYDAVLETDGGYSEADMLQHLREFRSLAVHNPDGPLVSITVCSRRPLNELGPSAVGGSPWDGHYGYEPLGYFTDEEVGEIIGWMPPGSISPTHEQYIRQIAGGHPLLLQTACWLVFNARQAGQTLDYEQISRELVKRSKQVFEQLWNNSYAVEQMLMMLIALRPLNGRLEGRRSYDLGDVPRIFSQHNRELLDLGTRGIIRGDLSLTGDPRRKNYIFFSPVMEWWVVAEIENSTDEALKQREKIFFDRLSRGQGEEIQKVLRAVWENKDAMASMARWVIRLWA